MKFAAPIALAVPAGTAVAIVVSREPYSDPALETRRWERLAALEHSAQRQALELLVTSGVFTVLRNTVLVVRIVRDGTRTVAAIVTPERLPDQMTSTNEPAMDSTANAATHHALDRAAAIRLDDRSLEYTEALLAATRTRPVFHGTTADGTTYSGFVAEDAAVILETLSAAIAAQPALREAVLCLDFPLLAAFSGKSVELPPGLATAI